MKHAVGYRLILGLAVAPLRGGRGLKHRTGNICEVMTVSLPCVGGVD